MLSTRLTIIAFLAATWCWTSDAGKHYDVACPGVNNELQCPEGYVLELLSVHSGNESDADCAERHKPAKLPHKNCVHEAMLGWAKFICDELEYCRLPKPDWRMFVCDYTKHSIIQITYNCKKRGDDVKNVVACEGQDVQLTCEHGKINIVKASYGRFDENTCTNIPSKMTFCASYMARGRVKQACKGRTQCELTADSGFLGKPYNCDRHPKYLIVDYVCR